MQGGGRGRGMARQGREWRLGLHPGLAGSAGWLKVSWVSGDGEGQVVWEVRLGVSVFVCLFGDGWMVGLSELKLVSTTAGPVRVSIWVL